MSLENILSSSEVLRHFEYDNLGMQESGKDKGVKFALKLSEVTSDELISMVHEGKAENAVKKLDSLLAEGRVTQASSLLTELAAKGEPLMAVAYLNTLLPKGDAKSVAKILLAMIDVGNGVNVGAYYTWLVDNQKTSDISAIAAHLPRLDVEYYLAEYKDLRDAFGNDHVRATKHWLEFGIKEGRRGTVDSGTPAITLAENNIVPKPVFDDLSTLFLSESKDDYSHSINTKTKDQKSSGSDDSLFSWEDVGNWFSDFNDEYITPAYNAVVGGFQEGVEPVLSVLGFDANLKAGDIVQVIDNDYYAVNGVLHEGQPDYSLLSEGVVNASGRGIFIRGGSVLNEDTIYYSDYSGSAFVTINGDMSAHDFRSQVHDELIVNPNADFSLVALDIAKQNNINVQVSVSAYFPPARFNIEEGSNSNILNLDFPDNLIARLGSDWGQAIGSNDPELDMLGINIERDKETNRVIGHHHLSSGNSLVNFDSLPDKHNRALARIPILNGQITISLPVQKDGSRAIATSQTPIIVEIKREGSVDTYFANDDNATPFATDEILDILRGVDPSVPQNIAELPEVGGPLAAGSEPQFNLGETLAKLRMIPEFREAEKRGDFTYRVTKNEGSSYLNGVITIDPNDIGTLAPTQDPPPYPASFELLSTEEWLIAVERFDEEHAAMPLTAERIITHELMHGAYGTSVGIVNDHHKIIKLTNDIIVPNYGGLNRHIHDDAEYHRDTSSNVSDLIPSEVYQGGSTRPLTSVELAPIKELAINDRSKFLGILERLFNPISVAGASAGIPPNKPVYNHTMGGDFIDRLLRNDPVALNMELPYLVLDVLPNVNLEGVK